MLRDTTGAGPARFGDKNGVWDAVGGQARAASQAFQRGSSLATMASRSSP